MMRTRVENAKVEEQFVEIVGQLSLSASVRVIAAFGSSQLAANDPAGDDE